LDIIKGVKYYDHSLDRRALINKTRLGKKSWDRGWLRPFLKLQNYLNAVKLGLIIKRVKFIS